MQKKRMLILEIIVIIFLFLFIVLPFINSTIFESQPGAEEGKDAYIRENSGANFGAQSFLRVGKIISGLEHRFIVEFNISNVSSVNTITNAKLQLYLNSSSGFGNRTIKIYRLTSSWNETTVNWTSFNSSNSWATAGGDYSEEIDYAVFSNTSGYFYNFTITSLVRGWVNGSYENLGLIFISNDSQAGNFTDFASSDAEESSQRPKIIIDYTSNAVPTINNLSQNSILSSPKQIGEQVNFTVNWTDLEGNPAQFFVCNSSNISYLTGCNDKTYCNNSLEGSSQSSSSFISSCNYSVLSIDIRTTLFYAAVCDSGSQNCSNINQSYFYVNHAPNITVIQPNGGETFNQSLGNSTIKFNVSDSDLDYLAGNIYYSEIQNLTTNLIALNLNLTKYCTDADSSTLTANNCSYSWNTTGLYGSYFITIIVNDSHITSNDSSNSAFNIRSLVDSIPPNITAQWIESDISSGETIQFYANVSEPNIRAVWVSINTTPQTNLTMRNDSAETYNVSWTAVAVGNYEFKVYANDTTGNLNNSMNWQSFTIRKPNATTQNEAAPSTAMPFSLIRITSQLNATDVLKDIYAYLNVPNDFIFISNYSQNLSMGNFNNNETKTAIWIVSVPLTESTYTINVTYTDLYGNFWNSSNFNIQVNSSSAGGGGGANATVYYLDIAGYPEVQTSNDYYAEAYFSLNGIYSNPDSIKISLYDPLENLITGPTDMTSKQTGVYNYTYSVPSSQTTGQWKTVVNATKSSLSYYSNQFWKLVGALFDVGTITIINSTINYLNISVIVHNNGTTATDLTLSWNLTRTDTNAQLNSGGETFAVSGGQSLTKYYSPSTTYTGNVKITFLGRYSGTETAGAYELFTTTSGNITCGDGTCNGDETCSSCSSDCGVCPVTPPSGGGGGGGGATTEEKADFTIQNFEKIIYLTKNIEKVVNLEINNIGKKDLANIALELEGIDSKFYTISPLKNDLLKKGKAQKFEIKFLITDFKGELNFNYSVKTSQLTKKELGKIIVIDMKDYFLKEVERLNNRIISVKNKAPDENLLKELKNCENLIDIIKNNIGKEEFINAKDNIKEADVCIDNVDKKIKKVEIIPKISLPERKMEYLMWIVTWILMFALILILIFIIYLMYKKLGVMSFLSEMKKSKIRSKKSLKKKNIDEKIKDLENKLKE